MRILFCFLLSAFCFSALAQETNEVINPNTNRLVKFYADNKPYPGLTNYPLRTEPTPLLTVPAGWNTNYIGGVGYDQHLAAIQATAAWQARTDINASNRLWKAKYDARAIASNVVNGVDGISLYLRATAEANWFFLNNIRTNVGMSALTRGAYKTTIDTNVNNFGQ